MPHYILTALTVQPRP